MESGAIKVPESTLSSGGASNPVSLVFKWHGTRHIAKQSNSAVMSDQDPRILCAGEVTDEIKDIYWVPASLSSN